jgi:hypothetical protein
MRIFSYLLLKHVWFILYAIFLVINFPISNFLIFFLLSDDQFNKNKERERYFNTIVFECHLKLITENRSLRKCTVYMYMGVACCVLLSLPMNCVGDCGVIGGRKGVNWGKLGVGQSGRGGNWVCDGVCVCPCKWRKVECVIE